MARITTAAWALGLPSYAAVNLESKASPDATFVQRAAEAERYALSDYLVALASGAARRQPRAAKWRN
jgi:hypothetical protein